MTSPPFASGSCLCGAVRFRVRLPTQACVHCHCSLCRKHHAAGYVAWFTLGEERLEMTRGEEVLGRYRSSEHGERTFCTRCGTSLFFRSSKRPGEVDVPLALMDEPIDREPQLHIHFDHRAPWVVIGDSLPRLGGESGLEPLAPGGRTGDP